MKDLSLNVLDIAQNSIVAGARLTTVTVEESAEKDCALIEITDDGCGMTAEQAAAASDPFFTTRTTRSIGMGLPLFRMAAEQTGGSFSLLSEKGVGTRVTARFVPSSIDMKPMGDMNGTAAMLISMNPERDFVYRYKTDKGEFTLDTRELRETLGDVPLDNPDVTVWIKEYLAESLAEIK